MLFSVIPGLLAAVAILYAIRQIPRPKIRERQPLRLRVRPVMQGRLGKLLIGMGAFELGHAAATLMILRATTVLVPSAGRDGAVRLALILYIGYNTVAAAVSVPAGRAGDRFGAPLVLLLGVVGFLLAYLAFAVGGGLPVMALGFAIGGLAIGLVETAQNSAVAALAPAEVRGSAFGLLAGIQGFGNLAASAVAGIIWTAASPPVAFAYLGVWMVVAVAALGAAMRSR